MKIQIWYDTSEEGDNVTGRKFSEPNNMLEAMVDLRKCQLEHRPENMTIELLDVEEGDV